MAKKNKDAFSKELKLMKVTRTETFVRYKHEVSITNGTDMHDITAHEAPKKSFDKALQGLAAVACKVLGLPADYAEGITVISLSLSYTKSGIRSASIGFAKALNSVDTTHLMDTPMFQIDDGQTAEDGRRQCHEKHAALVEKMIEEAGDYAQGDRQQMILGFKEGERDEEAEEGEPGDDLPGMQDAPGE